MCPVMDYEIKHSPINQISPFGEIPKQKLGRTLDDSATRYSPEDMSGGLPR